MQAMDLSHLGLLKISGSKAKDLLQGQFTCDLNEINTHAAKLGAHCNPQGRIITLFRIFLHQDNYYLLLPKESLDIALNALKKYAVFYKVDLSNASDQWFKVGYINQPDDEPLFFITLSDGRIIAFYNQAKSPLDKSAWNEMEVQSGHANIYPDTSEKFLPHELNLHLLDGISFKKGCYTGQEIIARMQYRGKLKNHLCLAHYEGQQKLIRGMPIFFNDQIVGDVIDYAGNYLLILTKHSNQTLFLDEKNTLPIEIKR